MTANVGLLATLEAKPGKEDEVAEFLRSAQAMAEDEPATLQWYAFQMGPSSFGIFDTFEDEAGQSAHLNGDIAKALMSSADELLASPPNIRPIEILASKS